MGAAEHGDDRIALLLDTDIGSDIDDAVALAYLLRQPRCELLGITTVSGDVQQRAACADVICRAAGRDDIPIHAGASDALLHATPQPDVPQLAAIADRVDDRTWPGAAVDFLRGVIRSRPGEVTLLSIGPLTNVGLLFALDPEVPALLKGFVSMAGSFSSEADGVEWNITCDPVGAAMAYRRSPPGHVSLGLDVTTRCTMAADDVRARFGKPPTDVVLTMAETWFAERPAITFHDPLAAAVVFHPELCSYAPGEVEIDVAGRAATRFTPGPGGRHRVAVDVDVDAFFAHYFDVIG
jgi:purine nucleosidase